MSKPVRIRVGHQLCIPEDVVPPPQRRYDNFSKLDGNFFLFSSCCYALYKSRRRSTVDLGHKPIVDLGSSVFFPSNKLFLVDNAKAVYISFVLEKMKREDTRVLKNF